MSQQVGNEKITPHSELPWEHRAGNILDLESPRYGQVAAFELERDAEYALVACNAYPDLVAEIERLKTARNNCEAQYQAKVQDVLDGTDEIGRLLSQTEWRPIDENTPKKKEIVVWREDQGIFVAFFGQPSGLVCDAYDLGDEESWWSTDGDDLSGDLMPTHWMPGANAKAIKALHDAVRSLADYFSGELNTEQEHDCLDRIDKMLTAALESVLPPTEPARR